MRSVRELSDATTELLEAVFSMWSVPNCYKKDKYRALSIAVNQKSWRLVRNGRQPVGRQSPASKGVNTEAEKAMALEAVTRRQPVKKQQTEKPWCVL
jgi:hypothetical protein